MTKRSPFKYFKTSAEIIRLAVMMYIRFPLSLRNVEDLLQERGIEIRQETVQFCWHKFLPIFAAEIRERRIEGMRSSHWKWHPMCAGDPSGANQPVPRRSPRDAASRSGKARAIRVANLPCRVSPPLPDRRPRTAVPPDPVRTVKTSAA
jgi:hypothetical protein